MPGELIVKVADNGRYGRTRFAAKSFELEKGDACNLMMIYPQYQGGFVGKEMIPSLNPAQSA